MKSIISETDRGISLANIVDPRRSAAIEESVASVDSPESKWSSGDGAPELSDLDKALVETVEKMSMNWPEFLPVERIGAGLAQIVLASLLFAGFLFAGLLAFCHFLF